MKFSYMKISTFNVYSGTSLIRTLWNKDTSITRKDTSIIRTISAITKAVLAHITTTEKRTPLSVISTVWPVPMVSTAPLYHTYTIITHTFLFLIIHFQCTYMYIYRHWSDIIIKIIQKPLNLNNYGIIIGIHWN